MTIAELGSLGELIAAIATVVTLAYLAIQIRANTIVTKSEADRASRGDTIETVRLIASSEDLTRIFAQQLGPTSVFWWLERRLGGSLGAAERRIPRRHGRRP